MADIILDIAVRIEVMGGLVGKEGGVGEGIEVGKEGMVGGREAEDAC